MTPRPLRRSVLLLAIAMIWMAGCQRDPFETAPDPSLVSISSSMSTTTATTTPTTAATTAIVSTTTAPSVTTPAPTTSAATPERTAPPTSTSAAGPTATTAPPWQVRPSVVGDATGDGAIGWSVEQFGTSVQGRPLEAWTSVPDGADRNVMVIAGVHGDETVGRAIVQSLLSVAYPPDVGVWLVADANPDGLVAETRENANGVDLNRNFPWEWRADDGGPSPLSEPEMAAVAALVERVRPDVVIWIHQSLDYVSSIGTTSDLYEQAYSEGSGLPVRPDVTQHGGGESWSNLVAGLASVLVEADGPEVTFERIAANRTGFEALLAVLPAEPALDPTPTSAPSAAPSTAPPDG